MTAKKRGCLILTTTDARRRTVCMNGAGAHGLYLGCSVQNTQAKQRTNSITNACTHVHRRASWAWRPPRGPRSRASWPPASGPPGSPRAPDGMSVWLCLCVVGGGGMGTGKLACDADRSTTQEKRRGGGGRRAERARTDAWRRNRERAIDHHSHAMPCMRRAHDGRTSRTDGPSRVAPRSRRPRRPPRCTWRTASRRTPGPPALVRRRRGQEGCRSRVQGGGGVSMMGWDGMGSTTPARTPASTRQHHDMTGRTSLR